MTVGRYCANKLLLAVLVRLLIVLFYIRSDAKVSFCVVFSEFDFAMK